MFNRINCFVLRVGRRRFASGVWQRFRFVFNWTGVLGHWLWDRDDTRCLRGRERLRYMDRKTNTFRRRYTLTVSIKIFYNNYRYMYNNTFNIILYRRKTHSPPTKKKKPTYFLDPSESLRADRRLYEIQNTNCFFFLFTIYRFEQTWGYSDKKIYPSIRLGPP